MNKVNNKIQEEIAYNYHTTVDVDNVINMTDYFNKPSKKPSFFAKLNPSLYVVIITALILLVSVITIYCVSGDNIHVNSKFLIRDFRHCDNIEDYYYNGLLKKYDNLQPVIAADLDQKALLVIYSKDEDNGDVSLYYDFHSYKNDEINSVKLILDGKICNIEGYDIIEFIKTYNVEEEKELSITIEYNGKKIEYILKN